MAEKHMTLHPDPGKKGVNIDRGRYELVRQTILAILRSGETGFRDLTRQAEQRLAGALDGSVAWYVVTVKLDLEARGEIERLPGGGPQRLRIVHPAGS